MNVYVSDAVAFLHYLLDRLPRNADRVFREAEAGRALIYLPTIAAAELYYLFERKNWMNYWRKLQNRMQEISTIQYYPFDSKVLAFFRKTKATEIHDKIIISTAKMLNAVALITKDRQLINLSEVKTIW